MIEALFLVFCIAAGAFEGAGLVSGNQWWVVAASIAVGGAVIMYIEMSKPEEPEAA